MTKDGRPSLINDIRIFSGVDHAYLKGHEEAVAFARRLAWFLNSEELTLGAYPALYLLFTSSLRNGEVRATDRGGDWWQRYTDIGVPSDFPDVQGSDQILVRGTVDALLAIRPDKAVLIRRAEHLVHEHGAALRFLLKSHETASYLTEISFSIGVWPGPSHLYLSVYDKSSGCYAEAEPISLRFYDDGLALAGRISIKDGAFSIKPNTSMNAQFIAAHYDGRLNINLSEFKQAPERPFTTKRVRIR